MGTKANAPSPAAASATTTAEREEMKSASLMATAAAVEIPRPSRIAYHGHWIFCVSGFKHLVVDQRDDFKTRRDSGRMTTPPYPGSFEYERCMWCVGGLQSRLCSQLGSVQNREPRQNSTEGGFCK